MNEFLCKFYIIFQGKKYTKLFGFCNLWQDFFFLCNGGIARGEYFVSTAKRNWKLLKLSAQTVNTSYKNLFEIDNNQLIFSSCFTVLVSEFYDNHSLVHIIKYILVWWLNTMKERSFRLTWHIYTVVRIAMTLT